MKPTVSVLHVCANCGDTTTGSAGLEVDGTLYPLRPRSLSENGQGFYWTMFQEPGPRGPEDKQWVTYCDRTACTEKAEQRRREVES